MLKKFPSLEKTTRESLITSGVRKRVMRAEPIGLRLLQRYTGRYRLSFISVICPLTSSLGCEARLFYSLWIGLRATSYSSIHSCPTAKRMPIGPRLGKGESARVRGHPSRAESAIVDQIAKYEYDRRPHLPDTAVSRMEYSYTSDLTLKMKENTRRTWSRTCDSIFWCRNRTRDG